MNTQLVLVEFKNSPPALYEISSRNPITLDRVVRWFIQFEDWEPEEDNIMFLDPPEKFEL